MKALLAILALAGAGGGAWTLLAERLPSPPDQPIHFDHRIHAGDMAIGCIACHVYATRGPVAGLPTVARCSGCHKFVKDDPANPAIAAELRELVKRLQAGAPIEWVRVHRLPDHVRFTHQRHVGAGVACRECHGEVERMQVVRQVAPLTMGWCVDCHRHKQVEQPVGRAALTECVTCHT